ncbi:MAG: Na/Pi symporter [Melioribacteraceae bacterium]|nr:Na/Pi symporter [Melioribacteraceae bacterium]MCF8264131.1 Na/Pi symporter [Melioribacteraceae bacterium]MCF8413826.1 Na/Pi symporter [Melioribacteraceae bacterium]MCF8432270.1 Na/Pi symporter [Melioribacteraceae bacterium]
MKILRRSLLPLVLIVLLIAFLYSENFKEIAAGVAILLFGMIFLEDGFKSFSGGPLEKILRAATKSTPRSLSFGVISTSLLQSSSLISVITISFLSAGLIELAGGIGVIFGANIGTTTGAWLISIFGLKVKISSFALPLVVFGIVLVTQKSRKMKGFGYVLAGIGFLFLGIHFMKEGFQDYQGSIDLKEYSVEGFWGLILFTFVGIVATVIMQSSHATLAIILTALSTSQINYVDALSLAIGANIGTTITAIIGAMSSNSAGKRLAVAHLIFNLSTGAIALIFIGYLRDAVNFLSGHMGIATDDYTLKLSLFHTLFNLIGVIVMVPAIPFMVRKLSNLYKEDDEKDISQPKFLSPASLEHSTSAVPALIKESKHLFDNAFEIIAHGINVHRHDILSEKPLSDIVQTSIKNMEIDIDRLYSQKIKIIYSKIIEAATITQSKNIAEADIGLIYKVKMATRNIVEIVKYIKMIQPNMAKFGNHQNDSIRAEYNSLRKLIARVMREIYHTQNAEDLIQHHRLLNQLREKAKLHDVVINGTIDRLIREEKITREMATSLMNDSAIVGDIVERLISVSELIYLDSDWVESNGNGNSI